MAHLAIRQAVAEAAESSMFNGVQDKYIGLGLAISSSFAIGTSFIITKKGLIDAGERDSGMASDSYAYLHSPLWWMGMITMVVGEVANFAAYTFAPPILVAPLGALSVLIGAVLAAVFLEEELGKIGRVGCTLCLTGSLIIVLHAPADKEITTVDEILSYAMRPLFLFYCLAVTVFTIIMIYKVAPVHGQRNPLVYLSICSLVGSVSVMAIKGFGVALKLTFAGNNQLGHLSTYFFGIVVVGCIAVQMNYFNKALDQFSTNVVNPIYYVGFSSATIIASLILFQGLNTTGDTNTLSLLAGFLVIFMGVYLLNMSRHDPNGDNARGKHTILENGIMPRMSMSSNRGGLMSPTQDTFSMNGRRSTNHRHSTSIGGRSTDSLVFDAGKMGMHTIGNDDESDDGLDDARSPIYGQPKSANRQKRYSSGPISPAR